MKTSVWGKHFWIVIHLTAMCYPTEPSAQDRANYRAFFYHIGHVLPCTKCSKNYERHFTQLPIDMFLDNNKTLFNWTIHLHNIVNKELGKPQWSLDFAESHYTTFVSIAANKRGYNSKKAFACFFLVCITLIAIILIIFFSRKL